MQAPTKLIFLLLTVLAALIRLLAAYSLIIVAFLLFIGLPFIYYIIPFLIFVLSFFLPIMIYVFLLCPLVMSNYLLVVGLVYHQNTDIWRSLLCFLELFPLYYCFSWKMSTLQHFVLGLVESTHQIVQHSNTEYTIIFNIK